MEFETLKAIIEDGGGYGNVMRLVFDNAVHINFSQPGEDDLNESDFIKCGDEWVYKEPGVLRSRDTYEYDVPISNYHPLSCLQSVIMSPQKRRVDVNNINDMMTE